MPLRMSDTLARELRARLAAGRLERILAHPFLRGLSDGTLPRDRFEHYVVQDALYLRTFARGLALLGARAPDDDALLMFGEHARNAIVVERALHAGFLVDFGIGADGVAKAEPSPSADAYAGFLLRHALLSSWPVAIGAYLPCYLVYLEVGRALVPAGSPDPLYARWIETYAGDAFATVVAEILEVADRAVGTLTDADRALFDRAFDRGVEHEERFWDAAWRRESW